MRRGVCIVLLLLVAMTVWADDEAVTATGQKDFFIAGKIFLGASALINSTDPGFSFGLGLRAHYYVPRQWYGFFIDAEWNKRGGAWGDDDRALNYIDFSIGGLLGRDFFFGGGFMVGVNLSQGADVSSHLIGVDLASILTFGYIFPGQGSRIIIGFDFKISLIDLYDGAFLNERKSITWGGTLGITF